MPFTFLPCHTTFARRVYYTYVRYVYRLLLVLRFDYRPSGLGRRCCADFIICYIPFPSTNLPVTFPPAFAATDALPICV